MQTVTEEELQKPDRSAASAVGGAFIVGCAVTAAACRELPDTVVSTDAPLLTWHYLPVMWPLLLALAAAGVVIMIRPRWAGPAAVVAAILSALVAAGGLAAIHRWFTINGLGSLDDERNNLVTLHAFAVTVVLAATAATVAAAALAWRERAGGRYGLLPARPGYVIAGTAVAVLLPMAWNPSPSYSFPYGTSQLATLTYALPWGLGLAAAGWMRRRSAITAAVTVVVSAVLCFAIVVGSQMYSYYTAPPD